MWSEQQSASGHEGDVRSAADAGQLLAFDGIAESFPIGDQAARLAYDEGATMVGMIIDKYGRNAIASIAAAWRNGDGDADALQAGTGVSVDKLYTAYFSAFGSAVPTMVKPRPILASNVDKPPQPVTSGGEEPTSAAPSAAASGSGNGGGSGADLAWIGGVVVAGLVAGVLLAVVARRRSAAPPS